MATHELKETLTNLAKRSSLEVESGKDVANKDEDEDEMQIEALEREVKEMAQKIVDFRSSIPERLGDIVSSASLALLRPKLSLVLASAASQNTGSESRPHSVIDGPQTELPGDSPLTEAGEREHEKLVYLRKKAMSNIATAPVILKRVNECLARINKIERNNVNIPSSFKRRKK
ncbi:uncharacterized protein LOC110097384 [Dendrobium catenatum]|uniref:uncharacterized protein LOC110097384 n=1 Tax=Dendrobium catenatum TaxID=906689 RepID=UPI0009F4B126|nr:uncharacterized protein LOC110097384 [Dendrobium catenatum]